MDNKTANTTYNINTVNGIVGDIGKIDNFSIRNNSNSISNSVNENYLILLKEKIINIYTLLINKKIQITLNENNKIKDFKNSEVKIQRAINYILENKYVSINLKSMKYQSNYKKAKNIQVKNELLQDIQFNKKQISKIEKVLNQSINILVEKKPFSLYEIELIIQGIIEYYQNKKYDTNIPIGLKDGSFYCYIGFSKYELLELENKIKRPLYSIDFTSGYDIFDLEHSIRYKRAIPSILFEMYDNNIDFFEMEHYFYLRLGAP